MLPIAHAEGRYQAAPEVLRRLEDEGNVALRYCDPNGAVTELCNPNGSVSCIAGVYGGPHRNVFGLMPHPERMSEAIHGCDDGLSFFVDALASCKGTRAA
jgi:phosphoribosylformylglycinamidine synthase